MDSSSTNATSGSTISNYENSITRTDKYGGSQKVVLDTAPAINTKNNKCPIIINNFSICLLFCNRTSIIPIIEMGNICKIISFLILSA